MANKIQVAVPDNVSTTFENTFVITDEYAQGEVSISSLGLSATARAEFMVKDVIGQRLARWPERGC